MLKTLRILAVLVGLAMPRIQEQTEYCQEYLREWSDLVTLTPVARQVNAANACFSIDVKITPPTFPLLSKTQHVNGLTGRTSVI